MSQSKLRELILQKIRHVASPNAPLVSEMAYTSAQIYKPILPDAIRCFQNELEAVSGKCILVENETQLFESLQNELVARNLHQVFCRDTAISDKLTAFEIPYTNQSEDFDLMTCGITSCEYLVARTGSVLISSSGYSGRQMVAFPPVHFVIAHSNQLVAYLDDALIALRQKYSANFPSQITTITGPSRTADIEKTLVLGAHGPKELIVFIVK